MKKKLPLILILAVLTALALFRIMPRDFYDAAGVDRDALTALALHCTQADTANGQTSTTSWDLSLNTSQGDDLSPLLDILEHFGYRPTLSTLVLGRSPMTLDRGDRAATLYLDTPDQHITVFVPDDNTIAIPIDGGFRVYHATGSLLDELFSYVLRNGKLTA